MKISNKSNEKFDIIIVAGQSNASGCGLGETSTPWTTDDKILMFNEKFTAEIINTPYGDMIEIDSTGDCYINLADERCEGDNKTAVFSLSFAKEYAKNNLAEDRKILLVQTAIGGTGFARNHWGENEKLEKRMYDMVDTALSMNKENRVVGVLWHQGEHDIFENADFDYDKRYDFYYGKLKNFITRIKAKYGDIPFVSGSFCRGWISEQSVDNVNAIKNVYKDVYAQFNNVSHVWETDDLKSNSEVVEKNTDNVHFCRDSCYELGRRYYEKYLHLIKENK